MKTVTDQCGGLCAEDCGRIREGSLLWPWLVLQSFVDRREQKCLEDDDEVVSAMTGGERHPARGGLCAEAQRLKGCVIAEAF